MQKTITIIVVILLLGAGTFYFYGDDEEVFPNNHYITGYIINITEEAQSFLVAENLKTEEYTGDIEELEGSAIYLTVTEETEIIRKDAKVFLSDLGVGERVRVWVTGPVLESYPARGTASLIVIEEEEKKDGEEDEEKSETEEVGEEEGNGEEEKAVEIKECFTGGCSGELCTDDPEAISTCELLPGMECLREGMSCELVENKCTWVLSEGAASCFSKIEEEHGERVRNTRIGYLFEKAENVLR